MSQSITVYKNSNLDTNRFDTLTKEAFRLINIRRKPVEANGSGQAIHDTVKDLKETTKAAVNDRLSTSQQ